MNAALKDQLKKLMVETLMLQVGADEISDDQALFGPGSLGLDSLDALQLVVMLDKHFGLKISDQTVAREILYSVNSIFSAIEKHQSANG